MVSFTNPGVLGTPSQFRRHFEAPILAGREPDADDAMQARRAPARADQAAHARTGPIVQTFSTRQLTAAYLWLDRKEPLPSLEQMYTEDAACQPSTQCGPETALTASRIACGAILYADWAARCRRAASSAARS